MGDVGDQGPEGVVGAVLSPDFLESSVGGFWSATVTAHVI